MNHQATRTIFRLLTGALALCLVSLHAAEATRPASGAPDPVVLSIFQVSSDMDEGYRSSQTISGSRTLAELRDTPNSISVLNREFLDDLIATKLADAMYFSVTGEIDTNSENANESFVFRGITANLRLRNGVTWYGGATDSYNIERVELLRGPQAFLYGEGTAGGLANQLTKQAGFRDFQKFNLILGSNELHRGELDVNRRLGKNLALRTALVYTTEGRPQNFAGRDMQGYYLTANWRPFRNTIVNTDVEYRKQVGRHGQQHAGGSVLDHRTHRGDDGAHGHHGRANLCSSAGHHVRLDRPPTFHRHGHRATRRGHHAAGIQFPRT